MATITLDVSLHKELIRLKSVFGLRIIMYLLKTHVASEDDLAEEFRKNTKTLRKIGKILEDKNLIKVRRNKETKEVYYLIHKRFYDIEDTCNGCEFSKKDVVSVQNTQSNKLSCTRKGPPCFHTDRLSGHNAIRFIEYISEKASLEIYDRKINKREYHHVDEWNYADFITFYIEQWREYFPKIISPERNEIMGGAKILIKTFRELNQGNWRRLLKRYIWETMKFYSENKKIINIFSLNDKQIIRTFLIGNEKKISNMEKCTIHNMYCSFWELDRCRLPNQQNDCTESIRSKMIRRYN